jgi:hypothetical protein
VCELQNATAEAGNGGIGGEDHFGQVCMMNILTDRETGGNLLGGKEVGEACGDGEMTGS